MAVMFNHTASPRMREIRVPETVKFVTVRTGRVHFHEKPAAWPMAAGADMIAQSCAVGSGQSARLKPREPHCRLRWILNRRFTSLEMCNDNVC